MKISLCCHVIWKMSRIQVPVTSLRPILSQVKNYLGIDHGYFTLQLRKSVEDREDRKTFQCCDKKKMSSHFYAILWK